jgi:hypothetical protein
VAGKSSSGQFGAGGRAGSIRLGMVRLDRARRGRLRYVSQISVWFFTADARQVRLGLQVAVRCGRQGR